METVDKILRQPLRHGNNRYYGTETVIDIENGGRFIRLSYSTVEMLKRELCEALLQHMSQQDDPDDILHPIMEFFGQEEDEG